MLFFSKKQQFSTDPDKGADKTKCACTPIHTCACTLPLFKYNKLAQKDLQKKLDLIVGMSPHKKKKIPLENISARTRLLHSQPMCKLGEGHRNATPRQVNLEDRPSPSLKATQRKPNPEDLGINLSSAPSSSVTLGRFTEPESSLRNGLILEN